MYLYIYELCSFSNLSVTSPTSQLILQPFRRFTYVTTHSPTLPLLQLRHSSFSNPSVASPTSQLILQHFRRFTYVTTYSPTLPLLHLRHSSFSNLSVASPTSQLILHLFRRFAYATAHSPTLPSLYVRHSSFSNTSVTSPTSHFILQPFFRFSYVTSSSLNSPGEPAMLLSSSSFTSTSTYIVCFLKVQNNYENYISKKISNAEKRKLSRKSSRKEHFYTPRIYLTGSEPAICKLQSMRANPNAVPDIIHSHLYIRRGNRRLSLAALRGLPAASRGVKLPLLADTRSVFQSL